jgi:hypothetical protein
VERRIPLTELPIPSTDLDRDPTFEYRGGAAYLRMVFWRDGEVSSGGLRFGQVRAFRHRAEGHSTKWHIDEVYDTLVEVEGSEWVAELRRAQKSSWPPEIHHYMIYIDSAGSYEIAALDWEWLPEQVVE